MDKTLELIEKYKREMLDISKRTSFGTFSEEKNVTDYETEKTEEPVTAHNQGSGTGRLKVMTFAGNEAFPLEAARVEVLDKSGKVLFSLLTNSGGIADGIVLPAPPAEINDTPQGENGFSVYTVRASYPGYETAVFNDVQVFEDTESIQQVYFSASGGDYIGEVSENG